MTGKTGSRAFASVIILLTVLLPVSCERGADTHAKYVTDYIIATKNGILAALPEKERRGALFITFWDFDGTILKGDCTEGLAVGGKELYAGLSYRVIEDGLSAAYPPGSYGRFLETTHRLAKEDMSECLLLDPRALAGNREEGIIAYAENYFNTTLRRYFFRSSMEMIGALRGEGIDVYVISASADVYVKGAAAAIGVPRERIRGIVMKSDHGRITREPVPPVTHGPGKTEVLKGIVSAIERRCACRVYVLAGFGNSYNTDGDFLAFIAAMKFPSGRPIAVMINGGNTPARYRGLFYTVTQEKTAGDTEVR